MLFYHRIIIVITISILLFSCKKDTTSVSNEYFVSGVVKDGNSGNPVSGVDIHFTFLDLNFNKQNYLKKMSNIEEYNNSVLTKYQECFNPLNAYSTIKFSLVKRTAVRFEIYSWPKYDLINTLINDTLNAGYHTIIWDGTNEDSLFVTNGIYAYRITTEYAAIEKYIFYHIINLDYFRNNNCIPAASTNSNGEFSIKSDELPPIGFSLPWTDASGNEIGYIAVSEIFNIILLKEGYNNQIKPFKMNANKNIFFDLKIYKQ